VVFWLMVDDIAPGVISREATYQLQPHSDSFPGVISFESIRYIQADAFCHRSHRFHPGQAGSLSHTPAAFVPE